MEHAHSTFYCSLWFLSIPAILVRKRGDWVNYEIAFDKLGTRYRKLRLERKMVQEDVLGHGFSVRHYQQLESGRPHSLKTFFRLSKMFNVDPQDLIKGILHVRKPRKD